MPSSVAVRNTRMAISLRLATSNLRIGRGVGCASSGMADQFPSSETSIHSDSLILGNDRSDSYGGGRCLRQQNRISFSFVILLVAQTKWRASRVSGGSLP